MIVMGHNIEIRVFKRWFKNVVIESVGWLYLVIIWMFFLVFTLIVHAMYSTSKIANVFYNDIGTQSCHLLSLWVTLYNYIIK